MIARVLVRLPNWLGDALLARPLMHALRRAWPDAELRGVAPAPITGLLAADRAFDRLEALERGAHGAGLVHDLAAWRPDAAFVLPPSFSSAWFAWRTRAARRVGFAHEGRSLLLTDALARPRRGDAHLSAEYLALGAQLGVPALADALPDLPAPAEAVERAARFLASRGWADEPLVLLGPGAIYGPAKRWPAERFAAVGAHLADRGSRVLVSGTAEERASCEEVAAGRLAVIAGEIDLLTLAGLCARATLAVCNDSGLAHLAAAVGTPTVAIFGSTSSAWTAPLGRRVRVVQRPPVCSPCFQRTCRIGYRCLTRVEVSAVVKACEELAA